MNDDLTITPTPPSQDEDIEKSAETSPEVGDPEVQSQPANSEPTETTVSEVPWYEPANFLLILRKAFFHGVDKDVVNMQKEKSILSGDINRVHAAALHYDNKAKHTYFFLQVLTAATASFAHGANDVSK